MKRSCALALSLLVALPVLAQTSRPLPHPVPLPSAFQQATERGTRTLSGDPGPFYWQNAADYDLQATIDTTAKVVRGVGTVRYTNNSPYALPFLVLKLRQNVHAPGVPRNRPVTVTGGATLTSLSVAGQVLTEAVGAPPEPGQYRIDGTVLTLILSEILEPNASVELGMSWHYTIPPAEGTFRQGHDGEVFFLGYWYPQLAVFDDVEGWHTDPYLGLGEHYMGYGNYSVSIAAPEGMLVWSTGQLENPGDVLSAQSQRRLDEALSSDAVVSIVAEDERAAGRSTRPAP